MSASVDVGADTVTREFSLISEGAFTMGYSLDRRSHTPPRTVYVSEFYMSKHVVTKAMWDEVRAWAVANGYTDLPECKGERAVHSMNWYDAVKWCNARSEKEELTPCYTIGGSVYRLLEEDRVACNWRVNGYRLPTEAEWEKADHGPLEIARVAKDLEGFPTGDWYTGDPQKDLKQEYVEYYNSTIIQQRKISYENAYGLYDNDLHVWQWCWDWYGDSTGAEGTITDPLGPDSGPHRVLRGGSLINNSGVGGCRTAGRYHVPPDTPERNFYGLRLARSSVHRSRF